MVAITNRNMGPANIAVKIYDMHIFYTFYQRLLVLVLKEH